MSAQGWYTIEAFRDGAVVYWATSTQRRGVWSAVQRSLADHEATFIHVRYTTPDGSGSEVAQVTNAGIWHIFGPDSGPLATWVAERQNA